MVLHFLLSEIELGLREQSAKSVTRNTSRCVVLTLSLKLRVINVKFLLQPHQKYYITQYRELEWLFIAYSADVRWII